MFDSNISKNKTGSKNYLSKAIRILTIPPIMVSVFVYILYILKDGIFRSSIEIIVTLVFLAFIPALAYPVSFIIPKFRTGGRKTQRELAFVFSAIGYSTALVWGLVGHFSEDLISIYTTYELSVIILLLFNKGLKLKASGHACSVAGPVAVCTMFFGWKGLLIGIMVMAVVFWASIESKRHTFRELAFGALSSIIAMAISFSIV